MTAIPSWKAGVSWPAPQAPDHTSSLLKMFSGFLAPQGQDSRVLDVGPVCDQNINFWLQRVRKLYVFDAYRHVFALARKTVSGRTSRLLDYPQDAFDGILCWDLCDLLDDTEASNFVQQCRTLLKPKGVLSLFTFAEQVMPTAPARFVVENGFRLNWHSRRHVEITRHYRPNREILTLLNPLIPLKSLIYRNGLREFLFQRE